ncbi:MAG: DUF6036 family nucleotidyltransferase [Iamia sp.]
MTAESGGLGRAEIVDLLTEVGGELDRRGVRGEMFLVGGAAMALVYDVRRSTRDVDAVFEPKAAIYEIAALVADRHSLPPDWINDGVKGLLPGPDADAQEILEVPGLRVSVASARYLLALKVAAARVDRDADDIRALAELCGLATAQEVLDLAVAIIGPQRPLLPKVQYLVEALFPDAEA